MNAFSRIEPHELHQRMQKGDIVLIDIREPSEYAREHITGARLVPLGAIDSHDFDAERGKAVVFTCRSGNRTAMHATRLLAKGFREAYVLAGGIDGWKKAGLPVHFNPKAPLDLQRQVQIAAGSLALLGAVLAWLVSPWFILLSGFVGAGLMMAGITGFCGLARLLAVMPWNRRFLCA
ncbi:MAG TPA: rhodanese family protein [Ferrovibrio sp.]|jgi:rhodanese-related sulfurtransferase|uniref:rhodanese-like domain-containing protein n=1 Tax=Ferrovibrio sp. TaxID=1917215 RepID=UPI002B4AB735|nr:rhodanese family protein [Ferrovibrio sp.]HLT76413.1 rhodanese family protein [Ferrovibrio sp.]